MAIAHVTVNETENVDDSSIFSIEIVPFTMATSGDYYDCKKLREVEGAFACQSTTDGVELQVSWDNTVSPPRVTITPESGNAYAGCLIVRGRI